jgi:hypothetical protein
LATAPRGAGRPGRGCGRPGMPSSSSPSPWQRPCRAVSPATTSPSTPGQHGDLPSRAQRDHHPTGRAVFDWRCGPCPLRERCTRAKDGKTLTLGPHDGELVAARRQAADPAFQASYRRWRPMWNARSPGWSPTATAGSATAVWPATSTVCQSGWPRSIYAGWSPWDWTTTMAGGSWPEPGAERARGVNEGRLYGQSLQRGRLGPSSAGASDRTAPGPAKQPTPPVTSPKSGLLSSLLVS